jgi:hypothetical protein
MKVLTDGRHVIRGSNRWGDETYKYLRQLYSCTIMFSTIYLYVLLYDYTVF